MAQKHDFTAAVATGATHEELADACPDGIFGDVRYLLCSLQHISAHHQLPPALNSGPATDLDARRVQSWNVEDVCGFLESNGLGGCVEACRAARVNGMVLLSLTVSHLCVTLSDVTVIDGRLKTFNTLESHVP